MLLLKKDVYKAKIKKNTKDKIPCIATSATKTTPNTKINEVKEKIPRITNLITKTALNAVENKIPSISNFVKKLTVTQILMKLKKKITDHNHNKYITILLVT